MNDFSFTIIKKFIYSKRRSKAGLMNLGNSLFRTTLRLNLKLIRSPMTHTVSKIIFFKGELDSEASKIVAVTINYYHLSSYYWSINQINK
jgi:hypothetical protein